MGGPQASRRRLGSLPQDLTSFVGRRREVAEIRSLVGSARLVTLVGPGGVGKTRIAIQVAEGLRRACRDGVWFIDLAAVESPELLADELATRLQIGHDAGRDQLDAVTDELAGWEALLVLDTCEHVRAACAEIVTVLLDRCPGIRILTTSREPLHLPTERVYSIRPFQLAAGPGTDGEDSAAAIQLFGDRATAVVADFYISPVNRPGIARICAQVEGLPLAIELAAQQIPMFTVRDLVDRLDRNLGVPTQTRWSRGATDRHASMEATLSWSYELCSPQERLLWQRAAIFSGGFEAAAAETVCSGNGIDADDVVGTLSGLLSKSVLIRVLDGGTVRMRLLDSVREFGLSRLDSEGDRAALATRHADWVLDVARQLKRDWFGPRQRDILDRLERERPNLRVALATLIDAGPERAGAAVGLVADLWFYWLSAGHLDEGMRWLERALDASGPDTPQRPRGLWVAALFALLEHDPQRAEQLARSSAAEAEAGADEAAHANAVHILGLSSFIRDDLLQAESLLTEAVERFEAADLVDARSTMAQVHLGTTLAYQDRIEEASAVLRCAHERCDEVGDAWVRAYALQSQALTSFLSGNLDDGVRQAVAGLTISRGLRDGRALIPRLDLLGWIAAEQRDAQRAATLLGAASALWPVDQSPTYRSKQLTSFREQAMDRARRDLGTDRFEQAYARGSRLDLDEALAFALGDGPEPSEPQVPAPRSQYGLTPRESEIARFVALGMSNKEIAQQLVLSVRTVENHVQRILNKLGFTSRTQVAIWTLSDDE